MAEELGVQERAKFGVRRLALAILAALAVLLISLDAAWTSANSNHYVRPQYFETQLRIQRVERTLEEYRKQRAAYPRQLSDLSRAALKGSSFDADVSTRDGWDRPLVYTRQGESYLLQSYGRDGTPGGRHHDRDLSNLDLSPPGAGLPEWEFLFHPLLQGMVLTCFLAAGVTFSLVLLTARTSDFTRSGWWAIAGKIVVTGLAALCVAAVLIALHQPTGH